MLLIAGVGSLAVTKYEDAGFIFAVLLINAGLGTYQEYRAESAAQALQQVMRIAARVLRSGKENELDSKELVPATS